MHLFKCSIAVMVAGCAGLSLEDVSAAENGNTQYSPGAAQFYAGAVPAHPGTYMLSQTSLYQADRLNDGNGDKLPVPLDVDALVETLRVSHVPKVKFGNAQPWMQLVVPVIVDLDMRIGTVSSSKSGLGDIMLTGGLVWARDRHNFVVGMDVSAPTGGYDKDRLANPGMNHWSFQPGGAYHYTGPDGWEAGFAARYIINGENDDTRYTSGDEVVVEYAFGYNLGRVRVGVVGALLEQLSDDDGPGVGSDGNRGRSLSAGPSFTYTFSPAFHISMSYQAELRTENRSEGDTLWFNFGTKL